MLMATAFAVNAQSGNAPTSSGKGYTFNFDSNDGAPSVGWAPGCDGDNNNGKTYNVSTTYSGSLDFSTSGEQEGWEHIEVSLLDADGLPVEIDLTNAKTSDIEIKLNSSVAVEEFLVMFADPSTIHPTQGWQIAADYTPAIKTSLTAGDNIITGTGTNAFDFRVWPSDAALSDIITLDKTKISEVWIYVRKAGDNGCNGSTGRSVAADIKIDYIKIGDAVIPQAMTSIDAPYTFDFTKSKYKADAGWTGTTCSNDVSGQISVSQDASGLKISQTGKQYAYNHVQVEILDENGKPATLDLSKGVPTIEVEFASVGAEVPQVMVLFGDRQMLDANGFAVPADKVPAINGTLSASTLATTISNKTDGTDENNDAFNFATFADATKIVNDKAIGYLYIYLRNPEKSTPAEDCANQLAGDFVIKSIKVGYPIAQEEIKSIDAPYTFDFTKSKYKASAGWTGTTCSNDVSDQIKVSQETNGLKITQTGKQYAYNHVQVEVLDADGKPATLDLSKGLPTIEVEFASRIGADVPQFMVLFGDRKLLDGNGFAIPADKVPAINASLKDTVYWMNNKSDGTDENNENFDFATFADATKIVDSKAIGYLYIYLRNPEKATPAEDCANQLAGEFTIKSIKIGHPVGLEENFSKNVIAVSPNPASSVINFTEAMEMVKIYNIQGNEVLSSSNVSSVNVESLETGVYVVRTEKGISRVVIK